MSVPASNHVEAFGCLQESRGVEVPTALHQGHVTRVGGGSFGTWVHEEPALSFSLASPFVPRVGPFRGRKVS